jgi:carbonic anhydrase/acetyltransferase-like protein (isoleucine patch superfamily)
VTDRIATPPRVHPTAFVARGAVIVGDVEIGPDSSVWFTSVIRGDSAPIVIGAGVNIQDGSVVHVDDGFGVHLEDGVTIGHRCIIHGCTVRRGALVGMGASVMNGAEIGEECLVGAGALVTSGKRFAARQLVLGSPARAVRPLTEAELADVRRATSHYVEAGQRYSVAGWHDPDGVKSRAG